MPNKFNHATLYEIGNGAGEWVTLFSNTQKYSDLVNHNAMDIWPNYLQALEFACHWVHPKESTITVSYLEKGSRQPMMIKTENETVDRVIARVKKAAEEKRLREQAKKENA